MYTRRYVLHTACAGVAALALGLTGCGGDSNGTNPLLNLPASTTSRVRSFNGLLGVAGNTPIDIASAGYTQQGVALGTATSYATATSKQVAGTTASVSGQSLTQNTLTLMAGTNYTLAAIGQIGQTSGPYVPQVIAIDDKIPANLPPDKVAVRTLNLSPSQSIPSIFVTGSSPDVQGGAEVIFIASDPYGYNGTQIQPNINTNNYVVQTAGVYTIFIRDNNRNLLLQLNNVNLAGSLPYTLFVYGSNQAGSTQPLTAKFVLDSP